MENEEIKNVEPEKVFVDYEFGDLYISCSCGHEEPMKGLNGIEGIRVELAATNSHELVLVCGGCGTKQKLFFKEAEDIVKLKLEKSEKQKAINEVMLSEIPQAEEVNEGEINNDTEERSGEEL